MVGHTLTHTVIRTIISQSEDSRRVLPACMRGLLRPRTPQWKCRRREHIRERREDGDRERRRERQRTKESEKKADGKFWKRRARCVSGRNNKDQRDSVSGSVTLRGEVISSKEPRARHCPRDVVCIHQTGVPEPGSPARQIYGQAWLEGTGLCKGPGHPGVKLSNGL